MSDDGDEPFTVGKVRVKHETPLALLIQRYDGVEYFPLPEWVPKSQIHDDSEVYEGNHQGYLVVKLWFAEKRGWV
jgi:hypothetical protein